MTRRDLLSCAAAFGGVNAAYDLMERLSLVEKPAGTDLDGLAPHARKETVLILGAGLAGLCAAYELERLGYRCEILEARHRTGGRATTVRRGTVWEEKGGTQECRFEDGHYYNPGPARIPWWHVTVDYCRKLNVPLAPFLNVNEGAYVYQTGPGKLSGVKLRQRDVIADTVGEMAEIAYRSVAKREALDASVTDGDKDAVLEYLREYGFLEKDGRYLGKHRRSFKAFEPTGTSPVAYGEPTAFASLFTAKLGEYFEFINAMDQQMTMMEPVGGMDAIPKAFERAIRTPIRYGARVVDIKTGKHGVEVTTKDAGGAVQTRKADYCVCTIPLTVLRKIPANFDPAATAAIAGAVYGDALKVATEYRRRFWEEDERVFGGITWTDQPIYTILYPSHGFLGRSGVLVNYSFGFDAAKIGALPFAGRAKAALDQTARIHPQAPKEAVSAMSVEWAKVPFNEGAYVLWDYTPGAEAKYATLNAPQGRLYFAGEHVSRLTAWMAGALESARATVKAIHLHAGAS